MGKERKGRWGREGWRTGEARGGEGPWTKFACSCCVMSLVSHQKKWCIMLKDVWWCIMLKDVWCCFRLHQVTGRCVCPWPFIRWPWPHLQGQFAVSSFSGRWSATETWSCSSVVCHSCRHTECRLLPQHLQVDHQQRHWLRSVHHEELLIISKMSKQLQAI